MRALLVTSLVLAACSEEPAVTNPDRADAGTPPVTLIDAGAPSDAGGSDPVDAGEVDAGTPVLLVWEVGAIVDVVPLDPWGRDLAATITVSRPVPEVTLASPAPGERAFELPNSPFLLDVAVEAPDHERTSLRLTWTNQDAPEGFGWTAPTGGARVAASFGHQKGVPTLTLFLGLDHSWFAATGRAPQKNRVQLYLDGEETWKAVHSALQAARERVTWSTWWWESDFELVRPAGHATMTTADRIPNTIMALAEGNPAARWRVLINRFWGENLDYTASLNTDERLRFHAEDTAANVEVMLQGNSTAVPVEGNFDGTAPGFRWGVRVKANPRWSGVTLLGPDEPGPPPYPLTLEAASWHQKLVVVDGKAAFVIGMNTKADDWDSSAHEVYDARRMDLESTASDRADVLAREREPDHEPRKDYAVRVDGPMVREVEEVFLERWTNARAAGALYSQATTPFTLAAAPDVPADGIDAQLGVTSPGPVAEMSILETQAKAFSHATDLVIVEDQYFRSTIMNERLVARMQQEPGLHLVVITMDLPAWDPGKKFTYLSDARFRRLFPDRYLLLTLGSVDLRVDEGVFFDDLELVQTPIFIHSKLRIVDDAYLSVGSCNFNNRGYLFEGELNVSVHDQAFVRRERARVLGNLVGAAASRLTGRGADDFRLLREVATQNAATRTWWDEHGSDYETLEEAAADRAARWPAGFVYPLVIANDYWFDPGPDLY